MGFRFPHPFNRQYEPWKEEDEAKERVLEAAALKRAERLVAALEQIIIYEGVAPITTTKAIARQALTHYKEQGGDPLDNATGAPK